MASKFLREYKVVVAGAGGVGKSCFIIQVSGSNVDPFMKPYTLKFIMGVFPDEYDPTIEDSYRKVCVVDNEVALFDVLDTAGQEEYSTMREQYMRTCEGMIIMYTITNRETFDLVPVFRDQLLRVKDKDYFPMLIVGNQSDQHSDRAISTQEGMAIASQTGCGFLEASAKSNYNVERAFYDMVREIRRYNREQSSFPAMPPKLPLTPRKKSSFFSKTLSMSSLVELFKPSKPEWHLDPDAEAVRQQTLNRMLIKCARSNDKRRVRKLLARGADVTAQPGVEGNVLHAAAAVGHLDIVTILLKEGTTIHTRESRGNTALHLAALEGHADVVKVLLRRGAPVDIPCGMYGTALVAASSRGHTKVARILLEKGANVMARGGPFESSFHASAVLGKADLTALLHDWGAEIDSRGPGGCTALQIASFAGKLEVVRLLLDRGAGIDLEGGKYGRALNAALDQGHFDIIDLLIKKGASEVDLKINGPQGFSDPDEPLQHTSSRQATGEIPGEQQESQPKAALNQHITQLIHNGSPTSHPPPVHQKLTEERPVSTASNTRNSTVRNFSVPTRTPLGISAPATPNAASLLSLPSGHTQYENANQIPFRWIRNLGRGSYGIVDEVVFASHEGRLINYARKTLQNTGAQHVYRMIQDEIDLLKRLRHKHVIEVLSTYSIGKKYAIIMSPVAEIDLKSLLATGRSEQKMFRWFGCLTAGLAYIHSKNIRHRDIKPANILVKGEDILFTDFGIAKDFSQDSTTSSIGAVNAKSYMYCAPEVAAEKPRGRPSDIYSLGCVFLELATVLIGSTGFSLSTLHEAIKANEVRAYHARPSRVLQFLLRLCALTPDREAEGWTTRQRYVLIFQWCFAMLYPEPKSRISGRALLTMIQSISNCAPSSATYIGQCCKESILAHGDWPKLLQIWPTENFFRQDLSWDELAVKLQYTVPEDLSDDNNN